MAYIKLNLKNYEHNIKLLAKKAGNIDKIAVVLKDNAYGHGLCQIAKKANELGVKTAVVRHFREAYEIQDEFKQILILADYPKEPNPKFIYAINDINFISKFPKNTKVHLKINTGMNRNGIALDEIETALKALQNQGLECIGAFTHHSSGGIVEAQYFLQNEAFKKAKDIILTYSKKYGMSNLAFHSHNSDALLRSQSFDESFARVGIATYGYSDIDKAFGEFDLKPVLSLWAKKICQRELSFGDKVGYGLKFTADSKMQASIYDVGYADGLFRFNGLGEFYLNKKRVLGVMSMDCTCIKSIDDEICIISNANEIARHFNTISYEVLVKLSPNLPKFIIE